MISIVSVISITGVTPRLPQDPQAHGRRATELPRGICAGWPLAAQGGPAFITDLGFRGLGFRDLGFMV